MNYLTWRQLRDKLIEVTDDKVLGEPALFAHLDNYGCETVVPMKLIKDTWHPDDQPSTVSYDEGSEQFGRLRALDEDEIVPVRKLPRNALLLAYSEMDEDLEETKEWLKTV